MAARGVAHAHHARAASRRAHLVHCIGEMLPDDDIGRDQEQARVLVEALDRAWRSPAWQADAPEGPCPDGLGRSNGEGICRPRRSQLYATREQGAVDANCAV
jgi:hypothetical protein